MNFTAVSVLRSLEQQSSVLVVFSKVLSCLTSASRVCCSSYTAVVKVSTYIYHLLSPC